VRVARASVAAVGFLWGGPRAREWLWPGLFSVRARTRGGIAAPERARLGLGLAARAVGVRGKRERARAGGYAVLSRSGDRRARGDAGERGRGEKGSGGFAILSRGGGERRRGAERAGRGSGRRKKGKLTGGARPSAAPGGWERKGHAGSRSWAGPVALGRSACGEERKTGRSSWARVAWAGWLVAH
jgi:hypothetical protein